MYSIGKTVIVGTLIDADEETATFDINGTQYVIPAIEDQGDFKSPLNRDDEGGKKSMRDYLMNPKKSAKRKLKPNDKVLLTLQKYLDKDKKMTYKLQNAVTFVRKLNIQDDMEHKGFAFNVDDVQQFIKKEKNGLPLYLIKISNVRKTKQEVIDIVKEILENKIVPYVKLNYKDQTTDEYITKRLSIEKKDDVEEEQVVLDDLEKEIENIEVFYITFFISATKQYNVEDKYEKVFKNNAIAKKPKNELDVLTNEDIIAFFEKEEQAIDNNEIFEKKILFGKKVGDKFLSAPAIISIKESYNDKEESFFLLSSVVPDIINIRKRAKEYIKNNLEKDS